MTDFKTGDRLSTEWWPESVEDADSTVISNITSTTFIPGSPECGTTFTAARSGRAAVCVSGGMTEAAAGSQLYVSFQVYLGTSSSGTLVRSAREPFGVSTTGDTTAGGSSEMCWGNMTMLQGLTPGETYYARIVYRVESGSTNDLRERRITVFPLP